MADTRAQLSSRNRDIFAAIHQLDQDRLDGIFDETAYRTARLRYEREAAEILERLDAIPTVEVKGGLSVPRPGWRVAASLLAGVAVLTAIALFLFTAPQPRAANGAITGSAGGLPATPAVTPSPGLLAAQRAVRAHPRSVEAQISLGNQYWQAGQAAAADRSYRAAMKLAPGRPEAAILHALVLGFSGKYGTALSVLTRVERAYPQYSRAWLLSGLFAGNGQHRYARAVADWRRFLALEPRSTVSPQVRRWLVAARRAERRPR